MKKNVFSRLNRVLMAVFLVFCCVSFAWAEEIAFRVDVDRTTVELGSYARLTLTVTGVEGLPQPIELPEVDGFESRLIGPQTKVSIVNGQYSSSYALVYYLYPTKTGQFEIPAMALKIKDQTVQSNPITLQVVSSSVAPSAGEGTAGGAAASSGDSAQQKTLQQSLSERLFVIMGTTKTEVYVNERLPVTVKLFVNNLDIRNVSYPQIDASEFVLEDFEQPLQYEQVINGIRYQVVEFKTFGYAMQSGNFELGPVRESCQLAMKDPNQQKRSGAFFGDDLFGDLFDRNYVMRPVTLESEFLNIKVKPLPDDGKPVSFSGAVGKFALEMTVSPVQVKVGDPVTVRMTLAGNGNMRTADLPALKENSEFKVYEPQIALHGNVKTSEQVVIPRHDKVEQVPSVSFWSFNPEKESYEQETVGPFALEVKPLEKGEQSQIVGLNRAGGFSGGEQDKLGKDIGFIKDRLGPFYRFSYRSWRSFSFLSILIFVVVGWVSGCLWHQFHAKLKTDERFARRLRAPHYARHGLLTAKQFLQQKDTKQFYDTVYKTIQQYFSHKLHMSPGDISAASIQDYLQGARIDAEVMNALKRLLSDCDAIRYASAHFDNNRMIQAFQDLQYTIDQVERKCR